MSTPSTPATASRQIPETLKPHKFFLDLRFTKADWQDKDTRHDYQLAIGNAIRKARERVPTIDLKRAWTKYDEKMREDFIDEFKMRLGGDLKCMPNSLC